jgi:hypothetical protein
MISFSVISFKKAILEVPGRFYAVLLLFLSLSLSGQAENLVQIRLFICFLVCHHTIEDVFTVNSTNTKKPAFL